MTGDRKLVLRLDNKGHAGDVYSCFSDDVSTTEAIHLLTLFGPSEAADMVRLLSDAIDNCATCGEPLWIDTAGECGARGMFCSGCSHPDHGPSAECERVTI